MASLRRPSPGLEQKEESGVPASNGRGSAGLDTVLLL